MKTQKQAGIQEVSGKRLNVSIHRLAYLNKPEAPVIIIGTVTAIINGVILPIFGILFASVIKIFYQPPQELRKDSRFWALMFILLAAVTSIAFPARSYLFGIAGCKLVRRIRSVFFEKLVHMEVGWFDESENSTGIIGARLSADAAAVSGLVGDALAQMVQDSATAIVGLAVAFEASWQLALIFLAIIPLIGLNGYLQIKFMTGFSAGAKMMYEEASQVANDAVGRIRTVASFCADEKVMETYRRKC